jgi:hypothetical protein
MLASSPLVAALQPLQRAASDLAWQAAVTAARLMLPQMVLLQQRQRWGAASRCFLQQRQLYAQLQCCISAAYQRGQLLGQVSLPPSMPLQQLF